MIGAGREGKAEMIVTTTGTKKEKKESKVRVSRACFKRAVVSIEKDERREGGVDLQSKRGRSKRK